MALEWIKLAAVVTALLLATILMIMVLSRPGISTNIALCGPLQESGLEDRGASRLPPVEPCP